MKTNKAYVVWAVAATFIYINDNDMVTIIHLKYIFLGTWTEKEKQAR